jgi:hypothetical protein
MTFCVIGTVWQHITDFIRKKNNTRICIWGGYVNQTKKYATAWPDKHISANKSYDNIYFPVWFISCNNSMYWLIDYLGFYVPLKNISLIWRRHHGRWRAATFRPMLGAQVLWAGRDLYRATPAVTRDLGFSGFIWRITPFSHLLRHTRGCGGSILTRVLTRAIVCILKHVKISRYKLQVSSVVETMNHYRQNHQKN